MNTERLKDLKTQEEVLERAIEAAEAVTAKKRSQLDDVQAEIAFEEWGVRVGYVVTMKGNDYKVESVDASYGVQPWLKGFKKTKDGWSKRACHVFGWTNPRPE